MDNEQLNHQLLQQFDSLELAEDYGVLCGLLCFLDEEKAGNCWRNYSSLVEAATGDDKALLDQLVLQAHTDLYSDDFEFSLLLPEDSDELRIRLYALSNYCRGFLSGIGISGLQTLDALEEDTQGFLKDIGIIAEGAIEAGESEEDETNYAELSEYIRAGTMLVANDTYHQANAPTVH